MATGPSAAAGASFFDSQLRLMPGVTFPLRSMLVETDHEAILISPVGTPAERAALVRPTVLVAPSLMHHKYLAEARARSALRTLWGPPGLVEKRPELAGAKVFGLDPWPYGDVLPFVLIEGAPKRNEIAFFHPPSRTVYTADLVHHIENPRGALAPLLLRGMGIYKRFAIARPWRRWIEDRYAFRRSLEQILAWDFDRIAMAHGEIVASGGREMLIGALRERGLL